MTRLTTSNGASTPSDFEYRVPSAGSNNGQLYQMKDWVTGEEVSYAYDALQRLSSAVTTGPEWGQSYGYDGFGNLLSQTVTKGTAPYMSINVNPAANRVAGTTYDANGNGLTFGSYDVSNRLKQTTGGVQYGYDPGNKRVWKKVDSNPTNDEFYFWAGNQRLGTYKSTNPGTAAFTVASTNLYFGGRLIQANGTAILIDRLGSNVTGGKRYFPYGQEKPSATTNNVEKFAGYFRDAETGLDYADQRYHNPGTGRFLTPDPAANGLNWYAYVSGDPVNHFDPLGLTDVVIGGITNSPSNNDITGFATSIGAIVAFPYANTNLLTGLLGVLGASISQNIANNVAAAAIMAAAADSPDPINIFTFSGGAAAFAGALPLLPDNVVSRINNVTYASPGIVGTLPIVNGKAPTVVLGNGVPDTLATTAAIFPPGTTIIHSQCEGHNASCELELVRNRTGTRCNQCSSFSAPDMTKWALQLAAAAPVVQGVAPAYYPPVSAGPGYPPIEVVTIKITYDGPYQAPSSVREPRIARLDR
jgi:RHS repeat-associated protein